MSSSDEDRVIPETEPTPDFDVELEPTSEEEASIPQVPAPAPALADEEAEKPWRTNQWHGRTHYECRACPFDCFDFGEMYAHVRTKHPRALQPENL